MKVLLLAAATPLPADSGQRLRSLQHLRGLRAAGAETGVVAYLRRKADTDGLADLAHEGHWAQGVTGGNRHAGHLPLAWLRGQPVHERVYASAAMSAAVDAARERFRPDVVIAGTCYLAPLLAFAGPAVCAVDEQNDELEIWELEAEQHPSALRRRFARVNGALLRRRERELVRHAQLTLAVSNADAERFRARGRGEIVTIPNAIDTVSYRPPDDVARDPDEILFTGTDAARNLEALRWFLASAWPKVRAARAAAHLTVAGRFGANARAELERYAGVRCTGAVDSMLPYLHRASVFIAPFRLGGGSRLKILEAGAAGLPVVSTAAGLRGFDFGAACQPVAEAEFSASVIERLEHPERARAAGERLRAAVADAHDLYAVGRRLAAILDRAAEMRKSPA